MYMKTAVLGQKGVRELALLVAGAMVAATMMFSVAAPKAHAAPLTEPQIQAILNLLVAFNLPAAEVANVEKILHQSK